MSDLRPCTGAGGPATVAPERPRVTERQTLSAPPRVPRKAGGSTRPTRRLAATAAAFAVFSSAAFGVVAATAPDAIGFSPTATSTGVGAPVAGERAVERSDGVAARPAPPPRNGRVAGAGSTKPGPGSGDRPDPVARDTVADRNDRASEPSPVATTDAARPGGQSDATPSEPDQRPGQATGTQRPGRGPIGAYGGRPSTGSSARPKPSDTQRPGPDRPGSDTGSAEPTRPESPTSEADGG